MLEKTKLVIGKACMAEQFRKDLFNAGALPDRDKKSAEVKAVEVLYVLERYEIYPSHDELQEILAVISPMPTAAIKLLKASPLGKAIEEAAKTKDVFDAVIAAIVGPQMSLLPVLQLVHALICPGLTRTDGKINRFSAPAALRCPRWPNCPNN